MKPAAQDPLAQLTEIRAIMERSSRFISLSGLSGVGAGVVALAGTVVAHYYLLQEYGSQEYGAQGYQRLFRLRWPSGWRRCRFWRRWPWP